jgi:hypothetical protein
MDLLNFHLKVMKQMVIYFVNSNTNGTVHLESNGDLALRAGATNNGGNIILYPAEVSGRGNGRAYIGWNHSDGTNNWQNEIATVGTHQNISNKTVQGQLKFNDGASDSRVYASANDIVVDSNNGNVILSSDGYAYLQNSGSDQNRIATLGDLSAVQSGLNWKEAVNLLYDAANPTLTGDTVTLPLSIDGHAALGTAEAGIYRVLIINAGTTDGIYTYNVNGTTWTLDRAADADTDTKLKGAAVFVEEGSTYRATSWIQQNHYVTDFADQNWVQFSGQGTYTAGDALTLNGTRFDVNVDNDTIILDNNNLRVSFYSNSGLDSDGGLFIKLGSNKGLRFDNGDVAVDYLTVESQLVEDGFVKTTDIENVSRKYVGTISGNGSDDTFTITHNLGVRSVMVQIYQSSGSPDTQWADVEADVIRTSTNAITVGMGVPPTSGTTYEVVIVG